MSIKKLTPEERDCLLSRGSIMDLELQDWEKEGMNAAHRLTLERCAAFLRAFAFRGIILDGIQAAQVSRNTVWTWRQTMEWFDLLYEQAIEEAADRIEAEAYRRAIQGYDEPVVYQGQMTQVIDHDTGEVRVLTIRKYSDSLTALMLKGAKPEKYRERQQVEHTGGAGGVLVVPAAVDPEAWAKVAKEQQEKYAGRKDE